jgi:hypothetical protein
MTAGLSRTRLSRTKLGRPHGLRSRRLILPRLIGKTAAILAIKRRSNAGQSADNLTLAGIVWHNEMMDNAAV